LQHCFFRRVVAANDLFRDAGDRPIRRLLGKVDGLLFVKSLALILIPSIGFSKSKLQRIAIAPRLFSQIIMWFSSGSLLSAPTGTGRTSRRIAGY
jgi:hypothetical protein